MFLVGETSFIIEYYKKNNNLFYNSEQANLLQDVFRHKVVHFGKTRDLKGKNIAWRYVYSDTISHLKKEPLC